MEAKSEVRCTLNLVHGEPIRFKASLSSADHRNLASAIERAFNSDFLGIDVGGKLSLFPMHNIRSLELDPSPKVLIRSVISDVEPLE